MDRRSGGRFFLHVQGDATGVVIDSFDLRVGKEFLREQSLGDEDPVGAHREAHGPKFFQKPSDGQRADHQRGEWGEDEPRAFESKLQRQRPTHDHRGGCRQAADERDERTAPRVAYHLGRDFEPPLHLVAFTSH